MQQKGENEELAAHLDAMHDKELMDRVLHSIDPDDANPNTACIKLLMCTCEPVVWGMQRSISDRQDDEEPTAHGLSSFFKHMPALDEFKVHKDKCSERFKACQLR